VDYAKSTAASAQQTAVETATQAKDTAGSVLQQTGDAVADAFNSAKETVTPKQ
jgi:hypothetical protein